MKGLILIALLLAGCGGAPTYDELNAEAELTGDRTKVDAYEALLIRADMFMEVRSACKANGAGWHWQCQGRGYKKIPERQVLNDRQIIRIYRNERVSCWCTNQRYKL